MNNQIFEFLFWFYVAVQSVGMVVFLIQFLYPIFRNVYRSMTRRKPDPVDILISELFDACEKHSEAIAELERKLEEQREENRVSKERIDGLYIATGHFKQ